MNGIPNQGDKDAARPGPINVRGAIEAARAPGSGEPNGKPEEDGREGTARSTTLDSGARSTGLLASSEGPGSGRSFPVSWHPIPFSDPMVLAIRSGTKTQTRRVARFKPYDAESQVNLQFSGLTVGHYFTGHPDTGWVLRSRGAGGSWNDRTKPLHCPFGRSGDKLWVREAWRTHEADDLYDGILFRADGDFREIKNTSAAADAWVKTHDNGKHGENWRPPMFMPRWASRISLQVTEVRVQRVQDISEQDAEAEGCRDRPVRLLMNSRGGAAVERQTAREHFAELWDSINEKRGYPWAKNPWVWAISFRRVDG